MDITLSLWDFMIITLLIIIFSMRCKNLNIAYVIVPPEEIIKNLEED